MSHDKLAYDRTKMKEMTDTKNYSTCRSYQNIFNRSLT